MGPDNLGCRTAGQGQGLLDLAPPKAAETAVCSGFMYVRVVEGFAEFDGALLQMS